MAQNIFLVGPMGAGKTTIGKQLARSLGRPFFDSDQEIRKRTGADIPLIFELEGEAGFRQREKAMIDELTQKESIILGTGGGAVLDAENRQHLASRGFVIYLSAPLQLLLNRTAHDKSRPLLQTENPRQRLEEILKERDPLYREVADYVITTDNRPARTVVKAILDLVKERDL